MNEKFFASLTLLFLVFLVTSKKSNLLDFPFLVSLTQQNEKVSFVSHQCLDAQLSLVRGGQILAARDSPHWYIRRPLVVFLRAYWRDFIYIPALLHSRYSCTSDPGWDFVFMLDSPKSHKDLIEYLVQNGAEHLIDTFYPVYMSDWVNLTWVSEGGMGNLPSGESVNPAELKTVLGWSIFPRCYEMIVALDADCTILRPQTLSRSVREKLKKGLVFASVSHSDAQPIMQAAVKPLFRGKNETTNPSLSQVFEKISNVTDGSLFIPFFSDIVAYNSSDIPTFLREIQLPRTSSEMSCLFDGSYDYWKLIRGDWKMAPAYVHEIPGNKDLSTAGMVWKMKLGEDWFGFLTAYGSAPSWASVELCRESPRICVSFYWPPSIFIVSLTSKTPRTHSPQTDDQFGIQIAFNADLGIKDLEYITEYNKCMQNSVDSSPLEYFKCTEKIR